MYLGTVSPSAPFVATEQNLYCCKCGKLLTDGVQVVDREVFKCGELDYIETMHATCQVPQLSAEDLRKMEAADRRMGEPGCW
jgi:hypothetical protein